MDAIECLNRVLSLWQEISIKQEQMRALDNITTGMTISLDGERVSGSKNQQMMETIAVKLLDFENEIKVLTDELFLLLEKIRLIVNRLGYNRMNLVLTKRYLHFEDWETIAEDCHIISVRVLADYRSLVSDLPDILGMVFINEADIYLAVVVTFKDILVPQHLCRLEYGASEHIIEEPVPFFIRKRNVPQFFSVELIELLSEISEQGIVILYDYGLISLFVQLFYQLVLEFCFTLVSHDEHSLHSDFIDGLLL